MHEYSIVQSLVDSVTAAVGTRDATVQRVDIAIGELAGVDRGLLTTAFEVFREGTLCERAALTIATIPAVLLALTQSVQTALIVLAAYMIYQVVENYVTSPRVFSQTLQLRPLVTLVAVLVGGKLLGIVGVLLALPVAAALPTVMEIWLKDEPGAA